MNPLYGSYETSSHRLYVANDVRLGMSCVCVCVCVFVCVGIGVDMVNQKGCFVRHFEVP